MSFQTFLASDQPMAEAKNPHVELLSVNEAIGRGIILSKGHEKLLLNSPAIDRDKPGVLLWMDSEENLGEITIRSEEKQYLGRDDCPLDTKLEYFSVLEWDYTDERAKKLIGYIREHLKKAQELEIWNIWIGYEESVPEMKKRGVHINELTVNDLEKMFHAWEDWQSYACLAVKNS